MTAQFQNYHNSFTSEVAGPMAEVFYTKHVSKRKRKH